MAEILKTTFQLRRGLESAWIRNNPILASGEPGWATDTHVLKIGDGIHPWIELPILTSINLSEEQLQNIIERYLEKNPVKIITDTTLNIEGMAADAAAVRELCVMCDDEVILFGGTSTN